MGDKEKEGEGDGGIQSSEPGKCIFIKRPFDYDVYTLRVPIRGTQCIFFNTHANFRIVKTGFCNKAYWFYSQISLIRTNLCVYTC